MFKEGRLLLFLIPSSRKEAKYAGFFNVFSTCQIAVRLITFQRDLIQSIRALSNYLSIVAISKLITVMLEEHMLINVGVMEISEILLYAAFLTIFNG